MNKREPVRVGVITLAVSLIGLGAAWLIQNLTPYATFSYLTRWWPLLLIFLGLEYLWRYRQFGLETRIRWSLGSLLILALISGGLAVGAWVPKTPLWELRDELTDLGLHRSVSRSFELAPIGDYQGQGVRVENKLGEVKVRASRDGQIHVKGQISDGNSGHEQLAEVKVTPGDPLLIRVDEGSNQRGVRVNYDIELPPNLNLEVDNKAGQVSVEDLIGDLGIINNLGETVVKGCQGKVAVDNNSGNIRVENGQGNMVLKSNLGMVAVRDCQGDLVIEADKGQINVRTDYPVAHNWDLRTAMGSIEVQIPDNSNAILEAEANRGSVNWSEQSPWKIEGNKRVVQLGDGQGRIRLNADLGSITVSLRHR